MERQRYSQKQGDRTERRNKTSVKEEERGKTKDEDGEVADETKDKGRNRWWVEGEASIVIR